MHPDDVHVAKWTHARVAAFRPQRTAAACFDADGGTAYLPRLRSLHLFWRLYVWNPAEGAIQGGYAALAESGCS